MTDWPTRFAEILDRYQRRQKVRRTIRAAMATARKAGLEARQQAKDAAKEKSMSEIGSHVGADYTVWTLDPSGYSQWTAQERDAVKDFLRGNGIDPLDVGIDSAAVQLRVRSTAKGWVLETWVMERVNGAAMVCPYCPGCVKRRQVSVPVVVEPPNVSASWSAFGPTS